MDFEEKLEMPQMCCRMLELSGVLLPKHPVKRFAAQTIFYVSFIATFLLMPACLANAVINREDFSLVTTNICIFSIAVLAYFPSGSFSLKPKKILELIEALIKTGEERRGKPHFEILLKSDQRTKFISKFVVTACTTVVICWCLLPFLIYFVAVYQADEEEEVVIRLLYEVWTPFDPNSKLVFICTYVMQASVIFGGVIFNMSNLLLFLTSIAYCSAYFKILQTSLEEVDVLVPVQNTLSVFDGGDRHSESQDDISTIGNKNGISRQTVLEEQYLINCIKEHQKAISLVDNVNDVYRTIVLTSFFFVEICIAFVIFVIVETKDDPKIRFQFITVLISAMAELFLICYFAEDIIQESSAIGRVIYDVQWYHRSKGYKLRTPMIILSAQRHKAITAGTFYELSYERFGTIVNAAYSMFTLLQNLRG